MYSPADGQWYGVITTLDTENSISQRIVNRLSLRVTHGVVTKWKAFNGRTVESDSTVEAIWSRRGKGVSHVNLFRIVPMLHPVSCSEEI